MNKSSLLARTVLSLAVAASLLPATSFATTQNNDSAASSLGSNAPGTSASKQVEDRFNNFRQSGNISSLFSSNAYNFPSASEESISESELQPYATTALPAKVDLRDRDVVTPVKFQNPFGTCWSFGAIAAAETSILSENNLTYNDTKLDLSELHLSWFAYTPLPEGSGSQAGEGTYPPDRTSSGVLGNGDSIATGTSLFSSGLGPQLESVVPYKNKEGKVVEGPDGNPFYYDSDGDWSVSEELRFSQAITMENSSVLPSPNTRNSDGDYVYDEKATAVIKSKINEGYAVGISFCADTSRPGQTDPSKYINLDTWAHYTNNKGAAANHAVTVVGYDDNYSKDNFDSQDTAGENKPPANGAWIVKNSWGAANQEFPNKNVWGVEGTGYFYLSYYDMSFGAPEIFDFETLDNKSQDAEENYIIAHEYDFLPSTMPYVAQDDAELVMANVFTADETFDLTHITVETSAPGTSVDYEVYLVSKNCEDPTQGSLVKSGAQVFDFGGYHRINLGDSVRIPKGATFSVVVSNKNARGSYYVQADMDYNHDGMIEIQKEYPWYNTYSVGVVNKGESFISNVEDGQVQWEDWSQTIADLQDSGGDMQFVDIDNFPIKAYGNPVSQPSYTDVSESDWFFAEVLQAKALGLMTGYGSTDLFGPYDFSTRSMIITILYRNAGSPAVENPDAILSAFADASEVEDWSKNAWAWAVSKGVSTGFTYEESAAHLRPKHEVTREQIVTFIHRHQGSPLASDLSNYNALADHGIEDKWANEALKWATQERIITGNKGYILPYDNALRAEVSAMFVRYLI